MEAIEAWRALTAEARTEPGWHALRVLAGSACDMRVALRAPDGARAVLFEVAARSLPAGADLPSCVGFDLMLETISPGPGGRVRLCLALRDRRYSDVFSTLADDVLRTAATSPNEAHAVKALLGRLHTWERFVSRFGPDRLTDEQQVGLFAELLFLLTEVIPGMDAAAAVRAWRGPYREAQDFRFRAAAVEVKATAARTPASFRVANLDQLSLGTFEVLLIQHVTVQADALGGNTLPDMVRLVRTALLASDAAAASDFDAALLEAGYLDAHADSYERTFASLAKLWLNVTGEFPRLTRISVPTGISEATYSVALAPCAPYAVEADVARAMIKARL
jgi:hypothetical protein